jgi:hypothetical protein
VWQWQRNAFAKIDAIGSVRLLRAIELVWLLVEISCDDHLGQRSDYSKYMNARIGEVPCAFR